MRVCVCVRACVRACVCVCKTRSSFYNQKNGNTLWEFGKSIFFIFFYIIQETTNIINLSGMIVHCIQRVCHLTVKIDHIIHIIDLLL